MDIHALVHMALLGLVLLSVLNLILEILGISIFGGERKPGFLLRLILVLLLSAGIGFAVTTYLPLHSGMKMKVEVRHEIKKEVSETGDESLDEEVSGGDMAGGDMAGDDMAGEEPPAEEAAVASEDESVGTGEGAVEAADEAASDEADEGDAPGQ